MLFGEIKWAARCNGCFAKIEVDFRVISSCFVCTKGRFTGRAARIRRDAARPSGFKPDGSPAPVPRKIRLISQCYVLVKCCEWTKFVQQKFNVSNSFENFVIFKNTWPVSGVPDQVHIFPQPHQARRSGVRHMYFNENRIGAARPVNRPLLD